MADSDGRSIFGVLYIGIALASLWFYHRIVEHNALGHTGTTGYAGAVIMISLCILFVPLFGIAGMYKLLTISKGKSNIDGENNIEGEKSKNSNLEVRIWRDKKKLAIIILIIFFFIGLF